MKRTFLLAAMTVIVMSIPAWGASITVTSPDASSQWCNGGFKTYIIRWTKSGSMQATAAIRLRAAGSSESDPAALAIADGTANDGTFSWTIPASVAAGRYFIRVRTDDSTVMDDSAVFQIVACPASITVNAPAAGVNWQRGTTQTIRWAKSGAMQATAAIRLRRAGSPESEAATLAIADGTANDGSFSWDIPDTVAEGQYFIRVRTDDSTVSGDSANFRITVLQTFIPSLESLAFNDLAYTGAGLEFTGNPPSTGQDWFLVANIKNQGNALIDRDVSFSVVFPDMVRDGAQQVTKHLYIPADQERRIQVMTIRDNQIPLRSGLRTSVTIDGPISQIPETNEHNNTREILVAKLDFQSSVPQSSVQLSKLYMQGGDDFRLRFAIHVSHTLNITLHRVLVHWQLSGPDGSIADFNHIIDELPPRVDSLWNVDQKFGKEGRSNAHWPRLREGVTYSITAGIAAAAYSDFLDVNHGNDNVTFTFRIPD